MLGQAKGLQAIRGYTCFVGRSISTIISLLLASKDERNRPCNIFAKYPARNYFIMAQAFIFLLRKSTSCTFIYKVLLLPP